MSKGGSRPGAGRPPTGEPIKKQRKVVATDDEWKDIQDAAKAQGKSVSQYLIDLHNKYKL